MTCAKCGVEIAGESAIAGLYCARCGVGEVKRIQAMELPQVPAVTAVTAAPKKRSSE